MSSTSPPPEARRYGRSQTPESPRPVHIPEPANIPVLLNQMDPVFNDTATYNISDNQNFSPLPDPTAGTILQKPATDEHDAVQHFFREAEHQAAVESAVTNIQNDAPDSHSHHQIASFPSVSSVQNDHAIQIENPVDPSFPQDAAQAQEDQQLTSTQAADSSVQNAGGPEDIIVTDAPGHQPVALDENKIPQTVDVPSGGDNNEKEGVDYQSLLDNIAQSASTSPPTDALATPNTIQDHTLANASLPSVPGLPPKPPPQETPIDFPSYVYPGSVQQPETTQSNADQASQAALGHLTALPPQTAGEATQAQGGENVSPNGYPSTLPLHPQTSLAPGQAASQTAPDSQRDSELIERPWTPRTQGEYDQFLEEERRYVTEGIWDKFPVGSRLFVGNLPSEKVTKRDLFHKFHRHGKLAQISIKQAYGFVQFLEAAACLNALNAEQSVEIRGRKVHLEISKPQKNTRGAGNKSNQQPRRRSRSPERNNRRNYGDYREDSGRRSNDYRNRRSPSPRGYRNRDEFRPRSRDGRPRSPIYPPNYAAQPAYDDEANLPLPRRDPRSAPDVQILVLESDVVQTFINWVEQGFRMKGLQASTIWLNPRLPLAAVIKRQIIEGVQAVVKLTRVAQSQSKIPLQVFDRSAGASNVNFSEYVDLDLNVAADIVLQARMRERAPSQPVRPPLYPPQSGYSYAGQYGQQSPSTQYPASLPPHFQSAPTQPYPYSTPPTAYGSPGATDHQPPNLQQLLANLRQPSGSSGATGNPSATGVGGVLAGQSPYGQSPVAQQPYGQYGQQPAAGYPPTPQSAHPGPPNVQNIMEQLARYQR